jgi:hypothetical protein
MLRHHDPDLRQTPIVLIWGGGDFRAFADATRSGNCYCISIPVRFVTITETTKLPSACHLRVVAFAFTLCLGLPTLVHDLNAKHFTCQVGQFEGQHLEARGTAVRRSFECTIYKALSCLGRCGLSSKVNLFCQFVTYIHVNPLRPVCPRRVQNRRASDWAHHLLSWKKKTR